MPLLPVTALVGTGSPHDSERGSGVLTDGRGIVRGVVALFPCPPSPHGAEERNHIEHAVKTGALESNTCTGRML